MPSALRHLLRLAERRQPIPAPPARRRHRAALVLILLLAFALRVVALERMPQFAHGDEANLAEWSQVVAQGSAPWQGVRLDGDTNWAFLQFAAYRLFGTSLWAVRVMSVLWSMLTLAVAYFGIKPLFGPRVALFAVLLMAVGHLLIHFGRVATIVLPSVMTGFLAIGVTVRALRSETTGARRAVLFALAGALLAWNLYQYAAAKPVFFAAAVLWLFALWSNRARWRRSLADMASFAAGGLLLAAPIIAWYVQHPTEWASRFEYLSVFNPRHAAINMRLYGPVDQFTLLVQQTLRSLGGFATVWDTSPNYHIEAALMDPGTAVLALAGLALALRRRPRITAALVVWMLVGLIGGAILLIEPPTSYHYIVLVPLAMVFAAVGLDWLGRSRPGQLAVALVVLAIAAANVYLYFDVYPTRGTWFSLESDAGMFVRDLAKDEPGCCSFWYVGEPDVTPRKISALIAAPAKIQYVRDESQLEASITPYLSDVQPDVIIIPGDKVEQVLPRLKKRYPGGRAQFHVNRGRSMFCAYRLTGAATRGAVLLE